MLDPAAYLSGKGLAAYAGLSVRTLRTYLVHPSTPMPHYRIGGKVLVKRSEFDEWMNRFRATATDRVSGIVSETLRGR